MIEDKRERVVEASLQGKAKTQLVLALCFTESDERYHYWRVFAPSANGVCIRFNRSGLLAAVGKQRGPQVKPVSYLTLDDMRTKSSKQRSFLFSSDSRSNTSPR